MSQNKKSEDSKTPSAHEESTKFLPLSIPKELFRLSAGWLTQASFGLPIRLVRAVANDSALVSWGDGKVFSIVGEALLKVIDAWGPLYGKAMQIWLSRISQFEIPWVQSLNLNRVYGDWPALPWPEVQFILDQEIPFWREELTVEARPLGVASMAQVHSAVDQQGKVWVIKFLKPKSTIRLTESIAAIEAAVIIAEPFAVTRLSRRFLSDVRDLCKNLRREMNLSHERSTMLKVHEFLTTKRQKVLRVPEIHQNLFSSKVIVMERLNGVKFNEILSGKIEVEDRMRKIIAKNLLSELLVQIFEWGLFHADPHAGNLMLLEDGRIGLYDWGLAGELLDTDRRYIAGVLKAIMASDIERLIDVFAVMGREERGIEIDREKIRQELRHFIKVIQDSKAAGGESPPLPILIDSALASADRLGISMPVGLLMMVKSLITIEGLARGIDQDVPFARVAGPVLFRAADPGLKDVLALAKQLPKYVGNYFRKKET